MCSVWWRAAFTGYRVTELESPQEEVASYASRAAEKLRAHRQCGRQMAGGALSTGLHAMPSVPVCSREEYFRHRLDPGCNGSALRSPCGCVLPGNQRFRSRLCRKLRERGATVCIVNEPKTPDALRNASDQFLSGAVRSISKNLLQSMPRRLRPRLSRAASRKPLSLNPVSLSSNGDPGSWWMP